MKRVSNSPRAVERSEKAKWDRFEKGLNLVSCVLTALKNKIVELLSVAFAGIAILIIAAGPLGIEIKGIQSENTGVISVIAGIALLLLMYDKIKSINDRNRK